MRSDRYTGKSTFDPQKASGQAGARNAGGNAVRKIAGLGTAILDLLYPMHLYCICCGKIIDETRPYRLCNECMEGVKWATGRTCEKCGKPLSDNNPHSVCYNCREHPHVFDRGYTCAEYGSHERAIVFAMKYDDRVDIARTIGEVMHDRLDLLRAEWGEPDYDLIIPVPMYLEKKWKRGFNQTDLIAEYLAKLEGKPHDPGAVKRTRETKAMRGLTPDERKKNIQGAFEVRESRILEGAIQGKHVLVVDDLYTTGATADAMTEVLREAGAKRVDFLSFAAGADMVKAD